MERSIAAAQHRNVAFFAKHGIACRHPPGTVFTPPRQGDGARRASCEQCARMAKHFRALHRRT